MLIYQGVNIRIHHKVPQILAQIQQKTILQHYLRGIICSYGHLSVISTYNPIYRMYNPIEITSYNW